MENKNGQGIFYGVIGVATLVVAIIGATFAYFSASVSAGSGENGISGQTLGGEGGGALTLTVNKMAFTGATASSLDLVPALNLTAASGQAAVTAKCEAAVGTYTPAGGSEVTDNSVYTGCHLYKVVAKAGSNLNGKLTFDNFTLTGVNAPAKWNYAIYQAAAAQETVTGTGYTLGNNVSDATGTGAVTSANAKVAFNGAMTANTAYVFYLLVWVANEDAVQNAGGEDSSDVTGSYSGSFTLEAAGGSRVQATFAA